MRWTLPNFLTVLRLLAAPAVGVVFVALPRPLADWVALLLFISASLTDYFDGWLARRWGQVSRFGAMLDPIADKAMVIIALAMILAIFPPSLGLILPIVMILFREVFVSGLREFLGADAGRLKVTTLAKWKTMFQMVAISLLFIWGIGAHYLGGGLPARSGILDFLVTVISWLALIALWAAAALTLVTGLDYFRKSLPFLSDPSVKP